MTKIKIAYFDLSDGREDYSIDPRAYGGSAIFGRWAKEYLNNNQFEFFIFAHQSSFSGLNRLRSEYDLNCIPIDDKTAKQIKAGEFLDDHIPGLEYFDIVMHHNLSFKFNLRSKKIKEVMWCLFGEPKDAHPEINNVLCFRKNQKPQNSNQRVYDFTLGAEVRDFQENIRKENFMFQCTRHDEQTNSIEVIENCKKYNIKFFLGGPIFYKNPHLFFQEKIDNSTSFYMGPDLPEETKRDFTQRASLYPLLFKRNPAFNISAIESLSLGTPLLIPKENLQERSNNNHMFDGPIIDDDQFLKNLITENETGFLYDGTNFLECFEKAKDIKQKKCWETSQRFSVEKMINSASLALKEIQETN